MHPTSWRLFLLLWASLALLVMFPVSSTAAARAEVEIRGFAYRPAVITIHVGDAVSWTNNDSAGHTVTFDTLPIDSDILEQGQVFSRTFATSGTFRYHCDLHPAMVATVTVVGPDSPPRVWLPFASN